MTGGDRCQRLIFQVGPCIPSLVAVSLNIETASGEDLVWHGEGRQVEWVALRVSLSSRDRHQEHRGFCFFPFRGRGNIKGNDVGKAMGKRKDVKQYSSWLSRWKPTSASVGASKARARSEAGALVVRPEPSTSKTERHVVGSELRILWEHEVKCAQR